MNKFLSNVREGFAPTNNEELDSADIVQTVLLIAGFAVAVILVVGFITTAVINKGADVAQCIEGANVYAKGDAGFEACTKAKNHAETEGNSFKDGEGYQGRFGTGG